ncbi:MAG: metallophosphoesterase, partial [Candidatus Moranbacteria bacterium]|nr:metallophosphoesterase [Candidatus Moranbacteria bacterium]
MITKDEAIEAYKKYGSKRAASKALGVPRSTFRRKLGNVDPKDKADEYEKIEKTFTNDSGTVTTKSFLIKTVEDALRYSDVDTEIWEVEKYTINSWQVTMKGPQTHTNYQVKVWLKRKVSGKIEEALNNIIDRLNEKPIFHKPVVKKSKSVLLVPGLVDQHFGLLAWGKETGDGDYDLKIAENLYVNSLKQGIDSMSGYEISQFLFPVGSDFFHINNPENLTPKGKNHLDVDSRLAKVFEAGLYAVIQAIDFARQEAPVEIKWIPGNHDPETSFYLCKVIDAYYRNDEYVTVDVSPQWRK